MMMMMMSLPRLDIYIYTCKFDFGNRNLGFHYFFYLYRFLRSSCFIVEYHKLSQIMYRIAIVCIDKSLLFNFCQMFLIYLIFNLHL
jgi:hypothetical protein